MRAGAVYTRAPVRSRSVVSASIALAVAVAGVVRIGSAGWGLPCELHVDEHGFVLYQAVNVEWTGLVEDDYRPRASVYGPLVYQLAIATKWALFGGPETARAVASEHPNGHVYYDEAFVPDRPAEADFAFDRWIYWTRVLAGVLGALAVLFVALAARELADDRTAILAAWVTALAPGLVQVGHFYTADAIVVFEIALFSYGCALLLRGGGHRAAAIAGLALGLLAVTKLPGVLSGIALPWAIGRRLPARSFFGAGHRLRRVSLVRTALAPFQPVFWTAIGVMLLVYVADQPWLLDGRGPAEGEGNRSGLVMLNAYFVERDFGFYDWRFGYNDRTPFLYWLDTILPYALGGPILLAALVSMASVLRRRAPVLDRLALVLFLPTYLFVGAWGTLTIRHILPAVPAATLGAASLLGRGLRSRVGLGVVSMAALGWALLYGVAWSAMFVDDDPRLLASRWLSEHVEANDVVVLDPEAHYTAPIAENEEEIGYPPWDMPAMRARRLWAGSPLGAAVPPHLFRTLHDARFLVVGDWYRRRAMHPSAMERAPEQARFYRALFAETTGFVRVATFDREPTLGPLRWDESDAEALSVAFDHMPVWIFERRGEWTPPASYGPP